jgi:hypothetical protein
MLLRRIELIMRKVGAFSVLECAPHGAQLMRRFLQRAAQTVQRFTRF